MPADPFDRALAEQWISAYNAYLDRALVREYLFAYVFPETPDGKPAISPIFAAAGEITTSI